MIVLALDTALNATSVAILRGDEVLARFIEPMERGHQERLAGMARQAMREAALGFDRLDRVGVTIGPGSFTGVRVGLAFAKGMALALGRPCAGVGTLAALAASTDSADGVVAAAIDGRRGQVYLQVFAGGAALRPGAALSRSDAEAEIERIRPRRVIWAGSSAASAFGGPAFEGLSVERLDHPDPVAVARWAAAAKPPLPPPAPLYMRAPDARTLTERAAH